MILQSRPFEQSQNVFLAALKELQIPQLLRKANIRKACGIPVFAVFQALLLLVFYGKNLFQSLHSKHCDHSISKSVFYRFLSDSSYNWGRFLILLAGKVTDAFCRATDSRRVKALVLDDSILERKRSKAVELLARVYDHVTHRYVRGFTLLTLGWSDGFSFIPLAFNRLSSAKQENRYQEADHEIDHRTSGWKARARSMMKKPDAAIQMIREALDAGIQADYLLADTWFITEPFLHALQGIGLHAIGMVKQLKQTYWYHGRRYTLRELACFAFDTNASKLYWSIVVRTGNDRIPVRIVFVRNRNKRSELLFLLTTDLTLSVSEVIRIYGNRWSIETFFKACKSLFRLEGEFQTRNYGAGIAHTALVFTRYIVLEWIRRHDNDPKTYGGLFLAMCEDVQDMELADALKSLMALFVDIARNAARESTETIKSKLDNWIASQSRYIKDLFSNFCWES